MKTTILSLILMAILSVGTAHAERLDSETQNLVIDRLDRILSQMEKKDASYVATSQRLADLLAERARLRFMNEVEANCQGCKGSVTDRTRAVQIYEEILPLARPEAQGFILFQTAHLYDMAGQQKKAITLYQNILSQPKKHSSEIVVQTRAALADAYFQQGQYKKAQAEFEIAFKDGRTPNRGLILYRLGWCHFNQNRLGKGIQTLETLAGSPLLLTKDSVPGAPIDEPFRGDVLRDLATFYSRRQIQNQEIDRYVALVPPAQRKDTLLFFGEEAGRVGQKQAASRILRIYLNLPDLTPEEKLSGLVKLAQANYDKGQSGQSVEDFAKAAEAYKNTKCSDNAKCVELQKEMRRFVTELHRSKKVNPDMDVLKSYALYAKTFPEDTQMSILGAQVATGLKQPTMAVVLYRHSADSAQDAQLRETALLGEIESAEKSGDRQARRDAYVHYLALMPQGPRSFEVKYQLAQLAYEAKDWKGAADQFRALALDTKGSAELRKKSADLALDALAIEHRDAEIERWSREFAAAFPAHNEEFLTISRKAVQNQAARAANDQKSSGGDLKEALKKMQSVSLKGATEQEKLVHYRNEAILAERAQEPAAYIAALGSILTVKSISAKEREETLARQVGFYEKQLNFRAAYQTALLMKFPSLSRAEKELRLGTLADLAGFSARKHYEASLSAGLSGTRAASVHERLVLTASSPTRELIRRQNELARSPEILSETILLVYAQTRNLRAIEPVLNSRAGSRTNAAAFLRKQPFYGKQQVVATRLAKHELDAGSDARLQRSIRDRVKLLGKADDSLAEAIKLGDYTAQIMSLQTVAVENRRMVRDLSSLPLPKGLKAQEQVRYIGLLKDQSRPYLAKSKLAEGKLEEMWQNTRRLDLILRDYTNGRAEIRSILKNELMILAEIAPTQRLRNQIESTLNQPLPSKQDLASARDAVRENPVSAKELEKLKGIETKIGHPMMSAYLEGRLERIQTGRAL